MGAAAPAVAQPVTIVVFGGINATVINDSSPGDTTAIVLGVRGIDYSAIATRNGAAALVYPPVRKAAEWMLPTVLELLQRAGIKS